MAKSEIKALAMLSSGLDSILAAKIVIEQGINVEGVLFYFRFDNLFFEKERGKIQKFIDPLGIPYSMIDISEEFLNILCNPKHGYGSGINPCIDCHIFMINNAYEIMKTAKFDFLITGEVVGQRPMSQSKLMLNHIDKVTGLKNLILRPLSAKVLQVTEPEKKGWVDREKLYDITGRSRKKQLQLVSKYGIKEYKPSAGGCILTDDVFSERIKKFFVNRSKAELTVDELILMRYGRHFWPHSGLNVIVGRNEKENDILLSISKGRYVFEAVDVPGPLVIANGIKNENDIRLTASLTVRYCTKKNASRIKVSYRAGDIEGCIETKAVDDFLLSRWKI